MSLARIQVIDSHTAGEPTRVIVSGGPPLGSGPLGERLSLFRSQFDCYRAAAVNEPRASDAVVGALLCEPVDHTCAAGVIFFNNAGYLGMCGHGTIGVAATLAHLGRIATGAHRIETPVGVVRIELHESREVTLENVASYRTEKDAVVRVEGYGDVRGDIAWGGNWFFLTEDIPCELDFSNLRALTEYACAIRRALGASHFEIDHGEIDHIELVGPPRDRANQARNFVLCPGLAYDRSPCGTGTSAKLACLYADGKLRPGDVWRQESFIGSVFEGSIGIRDGSVFPRIRGSAFVNAEATLIVDEDDPFRWGIGEAR
jgi:4-hydroxyproline epimerase